MLSNCPIYRDTPDNSKSILFLFTSVTNGSVNCRKKFSRDAEKQCLGDTGQVQWLFLAPITFEAWWHRGNMFTSHHYGLGSTVGHMWDVFHPSQPMPSGFPFGFSSTLRRA